MADGYKSEVRDYEANPIPWYQQELDRVRRLANRDSEAVQRTLRWSLPLLQAMVDGFVPPVMPSETKKRFRDLRADDLVCRVG